MIRRVIIISQGNLPARYLAREAYEYTKYGSTGIRVMANCRGFKRGKEVICNKSTIGISFVEFSDSLEGVIVNGISI